MTTEFVTFYLLVAFGVAVLLGLTLFLLAIVVWPSLARRRALRAQAKRDYLNARGTVHRQLLTDALNEVESKVKLHIHSLQKAEEDYAALKSRRDRELDQAFGRWAVKTHFREIHGIGPKLEQQILSGVFRGNLSDLHQAYRIPGIGEARQSAISQWVRQYEAMKPAIIREGLLWQGEISGRLDADIYAEEAKIKTLSAELTELRGREQALQRGVQQLAGVRMKDFLAALRDPDHPPARLQAYLGGVYEEWESMPEWFREAVEA